MRMVCLLGDGQIVVQTASNGLALAALENPENTQ